MRWRYYTTDDHEMVAGWWRAWNWPVIPPESLPQTGVIISNGGVDVCAAWLYRTDSCCSCMGLFISNKDAPKAARKGCVDYLIRVISEISRQLGFTAILATVTRQSLVKALERNGFGHKEQNVTNLYKV